MTETYPQHTLYQFIRERFVLPARLWVYRSVRLMLVILILALIANFIFSYFFYTPKMWALRNENNEIVTKYQLLEERIAASLDKVNDLRARDHNVYRSIFSADTLDLPMVWETGADRFDASGYGRYAPLLTGTSGMMDALTRQLYGLSLSLDDIELLAVDKDVMAESVPAIWPVDKRLVRGHIGAFGYRIDPVYHSRRFHAGIDFVGKVGTPIYATGNGRVMQLAGGWGYGRQVMIDHGFGYKTRYAHLSRVDVSPGQYVKRGEKIGEMGNSGKSTGPHLHYEVIHRGKPVNPINYFSRDMSAEDFRSIVDAAREITYEEED